MEVLSKRVSSSVHLSGVDLGLSLQDHDHVGHQEEGGVYGNLSKSSQGGGGGGKGECSRVY